MAAADPADRLENGAGNRNRTYDLIITNDALYQLSYSGAEGLRIIDARPVSTSRTGPRTAILASSSRTGYPPASRAERQNQLPAAGGSQGPTGSLDAR